MCSPADNLQTTDVIGRVVLLLFLLCFEAVDGLFLLLRETCEMSHATSLRSADVFPVVASKYVCACRQATRNIVPRASRLPFISRAFVLYY